MTRPVNRPFRRGKVYGPLEISERDLGWLEGFIDGEGTLGLYKARNPKIKRGFGWAPLLKVGNTHLGSLQRVSNLLGGGNIRKTNDDTRNPNWKPSHSYDASSGILRRILPRLRLTIKEKQRILLLEALELLSAQSRRNVPYDVRLEEIYTTMKVLNKRGPPSLPASSWQGSLPVEHRESLG